MRLIVRILASCFVLLGLSGISLVSAQELAEEQVVKLLLRGKKDVVHPSAEGGDGRHWLRVTMLAPFNLDAQGNMVPSLASGFEKSADELEYTLSFYEDAVFSNGKPITASAVKEAWEWGVLSENLPGWGGLMSIFRKIEGMQAVSEGSSTDAEGLVVIDDHTLKIVLNERVIGWENALASYMAGVFDVSGDVDDIDYWRNPVVSGPYLFNWDPDTGAITLTQNPNWWGEPVTLERIEFQVVEDPQTRLIAYENGEVDVIKDLGDLLDQIKVSHPDELVAIPGVGFFYLAFNNQLEPTNDPHIRRALLHAIDRRAVFQALFPNHPLTDSILQTGTQCANPEFQISYDPDMARTELSQSGYGNAENVPPIRIQYWADINFWGRILTAYQQQWQDNLGLRVELFGVDNYDTPNFNLQRDSTAPTINDPSEALGVFAASDGANAAYQSFAASPELDALLDEANTLASTDTARCELYRQIEERLLLDETALIPQIGIPYNWVVKPYVQGLETSLNQDINWDQISILEH
ncbi:MAG: ABC transporter substrate-binding protein [Trueperaceae bacterium]|nr:MAG: ABC transporter substrate-binding protein [Trueperaceae bacterium]